MQKPKEATTYEECLAAVRQLTAKHNLPPEAPVKKRRVRGLAERLGWKATPELLALFARKRIAL
jgi:hypothetical protein